MHFAIQLQRIALGDNRFIFKPISIIRGEYREVDETFVDEFGFEHFLMKDNSPSQDRYYCSPTTLEQLDEVYEGRLSDSEMIDEFLADYLDICFIGYHDEVDDITKVMQLDFYKLEKLINENRPVFDIESADNIVQVDAENDQKFVFTLNDLKEFKDFKNIEELRAYIDNLIAAGQYIKEKNQTTQTEPEVAEEKKSEKKKESKTYKLDREGSQKFNLKEVRKLILEDVIEQDKAVFDITRELFINETSKNPRNRSHILVTGPTGTGKTEIVRKLSQIFNKPFFVADANQYTKDGYVGKSVSGMLLGLIDAAGGDLEKAQNGILAIDEIDKKLSGDKNDPTGEAVLNGLLKLSERDIVEIETIENGIRKVIRFDTSNLSIVFMGAFEKLYDKKMKENNSHIGFGVAKKEITKREIEITKNDLIKEGFPAELLGRIGSVTSTYSFDEDGLVKLLNKSKISPLLIIKQYLEESFGIELKVSKGFIREIAKKALKTGTNARELKPIIKESMNEALEEIFNGRKAKVLRLRKETVTNNKKYYFE